MEGRLNVLLWNALKKVQTHSLSESGMVLKSTPPFSNAHSAHLLIIRGQREKVQ